MEFLKKFFSNDTTVIGLCELKRRQTINSFNFSRNYNFSQPFTPVAEPIYMMNGKF